MFEDRNMDFRQYRVFEQELRDAGFSTRTINGLLHGSKLTSIAELRSRPWGSRNEDGSLCQELNRSPNLGPKGLAEVQAYCAGQDPRTAVAPGMPKVIVPLNPQLMTALDAWIATQPRPVSRPEAIRSFVAAALHLLSAD